MTTLLAFPPVPCTVTVFEVPRVVIALLDTSRTLLLLAVVIVTVALWPSRKVAGTVVSEIVTPYETTLLDTVLVRSTSLDRAGHGGAVRVGGVGQRGEGDRGGVADLDRADVGFGDTEAGMTIFGHVRERDEAAAGR